MKKLMISAILLLGFVVAGYAQTSDTLIGKKSRRLNANDRNAVQDRPPGAGVPLSGGQVRQTPKTNGGTPNGATQGATYADTARFEGKRYRENKAADSTKYRSGTKADRPRPAKRSK